MHDLCVVFDVDDTLYLERDYVASGFRAVGHWAGSWLHIPDFEARCLHFFETGQRGNIFDLALRACDHPSSPELISGLVAIYRGHMPQIEMSGDAALAVEQIRAVWPVAVITDGPAISQSRKCEALGLPGLASLIVLTGTRGDRFHKPQPGAFEYVASRIPARNYVYVADNPAKDFTAPSELGWHSIRIRRHGGLHCERDNDFVVPDFELADCSDLVSIVAGLATHGRRPTGVHL